MRSKQEPKKTAAIQNFDISATPFAIAKSRSHEPFVYAFVARPENISQQSFGTLIGALSVSTRNEDAAYIVNHIAAIAKREYYFNTRRGAIESFESMLRRINLSLAEAAKNGQVSWVGTLHGAIAAIEKNSVHFSVTGDALALLFRNDQLLNIGEGLAHPDAATNPLKTFTEISSGRLMVGDCLALASPEIMDIFTLSDLERNARRLVPKRKFSRFIETALTNELRSGSAIVADIFEKELSSAIVVSEQPVKDDTAAPKKKNYWGAQVLETKRKLAQKISGKDAEKNQHQIEETKPQEKKQPSGDIYVQGESLPDTFEKHPLLISLQWKTEDIQIALRSAHTASWKTVKKFFANQRFFFEEALSRFFERSIAKIKKAFQRSATSAPTTKTTASETTQPTKSSIAKPFFQIPGWISSINFRALSRHTTLPYNARTTINLFTTKALPVILRWLSTTIAITKTIFLTAKRRFFLLPPKKQLLFAAGGAFLLTTGIIIIRNIINQPEEIPVTIEEISLPIQSEFPPKEEISAQLATISKKIPTENTLASIYLDGALFIVTTSGIVDPETGELFSAPEAIVSAFPMNDLDAILLFTDKRELFLFYPVNKRFVKNDLTLPNNILQPIGTFLTYIYLLETENGRIYRFPRAENGFGEGKAWLSATTQPEHIKGGAVSDVIYLYSDTDVIALLRGKTDINFSLEQPTTPLTITALCANSKTPDTFAILDAPAKRIIIYSNDGKIQKQFFDETLSKATSCAIANDESAIALSSETETFIIENK